MGERAPSAKSTSKLAHAASHRAAGLHPQRPTWQARGLSEALPGSGTAADADGSANSGAGAAAALANSPSEHNTAKRCRAIATASNNGCEAPPNSPALRALRRDQGAAFWPELLDTQRTGTAALPHATWLRVHACDPWWTVLAPAPEHHSSPWGRDPLRHASDPHNPPRARQDAQARWQESTSKNIMDGRSRLLGAATQKFKFPRSQLKPLSCPKGKLPATTPAPLVSSWGKAFIKRATTPGHNAGDAVKVMTSWLRRLEPTQR